VETLKQRIDKDMKDAMRAREKERLGAIRLLLAAIKQVEIDQRIELDDTAVLVVIDKMSKQRRESIEQYNKAGRDDLAAQEDFELGILLGYLPAQLDEAEINALIDEAFNTTGAASMQDMGKVMALLKPKLQGRADIGAVSGKVRQRLGQAN